MKASERTASRKSIEDFYKLNKLKGKVYTYNYFKQPMVKPKSVTYAQQLINVTHQLEIWVLDILLKSSRISPKINSAAENGLQSLV